MIRIILILINIIIMMIMIMIIMPIMTLLINVTINDNNNKLRPVHLSRVSLLRVLESNFPGDTLQNSTDMRIPTP